MENSKGKYDLEERTYKYAKRVSAYVKGLNNTITNIEYGKQLVRAAGSVGANYIEANEAMSKKDFAYRVKICRKEVKESRFFIKLTVPRSAYLEEQQVLIKEATELMKIFGSIVTKLV